MPQHGLGLRDLRERLVLAREYHHDRMNIKVVVSESMTNER